MRSHGAPASAQFTASGDPRSPCPGYSVAAAGATIVGRPPPREGVPSSERVFALLDSADTACAKTSCLDTHTIVFVPLDGRDAGSCLPVCAAHLRELVSSCYLGARAGGGDFVVEPLARATERGWQPLWRVGLAAGD